MFSSISRIAVALVTGLLLVTTTATTVFAESNDVPPTAREVLLLITEEVVLEEGESPTEGYWWVDSASPEWTESDKRLRAGLTEAGVDLVGLSGNQRISKIYRMPSLSMANAATLGSLLGARRVIVGTISYQRHPGIGVLGLERVAASVDVSLVSAESGETTALQRFTLEREAFAAQPDDALDKARSETTDGLVAMLSSTLMRGPGPVGVSTDEPMIGLRNPENARALQTVINFLEDLDPVEAVVVRWASEGVLALEINPGKEDTEDTFEYVLRALNSESFEEFSLSRRQPASADRLTEFEVVIDDESTFR
ncbi:MAG: hypothetical protein ACLFVJ_03025 [Persicimonas sp.]